MEYELTKLSPAPESRDSDTAGIRYTTLSLSDVSHRISRMQIILGRNCSLLSRINLSYPSATFDLPYAGTCAFDTNVICVKLSAALPVYRKTQLDRAKLLYTKTPPCRASVPDL